MKKNVVFQFDIGEVVWLPPHNERGIPKSGVVGRLQYDGECNSYLVDTTYEGDFATYMEDELRPIGGPHPGRVVTVTICGHTPGMELVREVVKAINAMDL